MMAQGISGDAPIPAKRAGRVNISARPHAGGPNKEVQCNRFVTLRADIAILKNQVNIDKFPKMFTGRTNDIFRFE